MPQKPKGARLYQHPQTGIYLIRDTGRGDRSTGTRDRREAERQLAVYIAERDRRPGGPATPDEMTIVEALTIYGSEHAPTVKDPARIGYAIEALISWWGERPISTITRETSRAYGRGRRMVIARDPKTRDPIAWAPCAPGTIRKELGVLAAAIQYCKDEGHLLNPPKVHLPAKPAPKDRWLTRNEAARLLKAAYRHQETRHIARFILVALYTGTRKAAILGLRFKPHPEGGRVDTTSGRLYRRADGEAETKKRTPPIPLTPRLMAHLKRWEKEGTRFVVAFDGQGIESIKTGWTSVVARAGLQDVTPHTLRHTAITWACQSGRADMWTLGGYFGVSPETMQHVYAHHHPDYQKDAVEAVGGRKL